MAVFSCLTRIVTVSEIRCFKISVSRAVAGQSCSIAVRWKDKDSELKLEDMTKAKTILVDFDEIPKLSYEFKAELTLYSTESEISLSSNTEIYVNSETFKQCCTIGRNRDLQNGLKLERVISKSKDKKIEPVVEKKKKRSDSEVCIGTDLFGVLKQSHFSASLKSGETNFVNLRFKFNPQFVMKGQRIVIYTPKLKAVGVVIKVYD